MVITKPKIVGALDFLEQSSRWAEKGVPFFFLVDFELSSFYLNRLEEVADENVLFNIKGQSNEAEVYGMGKHSFSFTPKPINKTSYQSAFQLVQENLNTGNSYLVNLTFPTSLQTSATLSDIYFSSQAPYKLLFDDQFVVFSPECFVKVVDDFIYSYPMKGTIDAGIPNAERILLNDAKERAEHNTIVDLIRNDLAMVSSEVTVTKFRYIDYIATNRKNLLQVSSEIKGKLKKDWRSRFGEMILKLLPAGSISGAPKKETVRIIQEAEQQKRGWYTGIFGIFDGHNLDTAVNIRFIEKTKQGLQFRSGGGITVFSDMDREYNEMLDKVYVPTI